MSAKPFSGVVTWPRAAAYGIAAIVMGVVVGELAAMLVFAGSAGRRLDEQAARSADAAPAVVAASAELSRASQTRAALDAAVTDASRRRDEALVVARCEYNPSPACPQTRITGVPGAGPENRTANGFLADTQQQLDTAVAERGRLVPSLDATIADQQRRIGQARDAAVAGADRGFGARWLAMNAYTLSSAGATVLRALLTGLCIVAFLFPLMLKLSRAKTTEDRRTAAQAERERADFDADTVIAVKKAEVRAAIETLKADHELASARMEIEAQHEIDREQQRRRVAAALEAPPTPVFSQRVAESVAELRPVTELEAVAEPASPVEEPSDNLPALADKPGAVAKRTLIPAVPDVAKAATRWIRPLVPPIVVSAIDTTTRPLRAARQVFEETEEIHISVRRSHRVSMASEETVEPPQASAMSQNATSCESTSPTSSSWVSGSASLPSAST